MELLLQVREGISLVVSLEAQPALRPAQVEAARVDLYIGYADDDYGNSEYLGSALPGTTFVKEYNPDRDRDLRIYAVPVALDGTPAVAQMLDADSVDLPINRMVDTPVIVQPTNATNTSVSLTVPPNRYARFIRFRVSPNADMSGATETILPAGNDNQGNILEITRGTPGVGTQTRYVTVAFDAGSGYGPESDITTIIFATSGGTGGSSGTPLPPGVMQPVTVS